MPRSARERGMWWCCCTMVGMVLVPVAWASGGRRLVVDVVDWGGVGGRYSGSIWRQDGVVISKFGVGVDISHYCYYL
jgi:hypothetical protein